ncbi:heavy-metal-associated domain-containing protein [Pusillimonas sp. ANT_WB101]|uniref:heavy-metal-associated domain-containing protein n=1 Tax=Pusillimonas sp. ANT_WB101 TaxID=2597356 RepID=UPI0011EF731F|nr:heavy-metal-associated domain-containing protein [Pusillimonas sp. ANT_WB101]KAA0892530.1 heavy-metal-associated domain-containing protein [Pusillimonas sp. ANT_WB101]
MIEFEVNNMSCHHCVETITRAVKEAVPGARVDINLPEKIVRIEGASDIDVLQRAIREVGYTPTIK